MEIVCARVDDVDELIRYDQHITREVMSKKVAMGEVLVARVEGELVGELRFSFFWDLIPFMNLLFVKEAYRQQGIGSALVRRWEEEMAKQGYGHVMTSTLSNESAQHFYRKLGYLDAGGLLLPDEPLEIIFHKYL